MTSYRAGTIPQRDYRSSSAQRAAASVQPGQEDRATTYFVLPDSLLDLRPRGLPFSTLAIARYLVNMDRLGRLDQRLTDRIIAHDTRLSHRAVQSALHSLERWGMIRRRRAHGGRDIALTETLLIARRIAEGQP